MTSGRGPSQGHSAHVGQEVVVHYRWHPLCGRLVRRHYSEQRTTGEIVHVEAVPGVVTVVAAWMLDPVACTGMEIGAPRVSLAALTDLHRLLIAQGFRGRSVGCALNNDCGKRIANVLSGREALARAVERPSRLQRHGGAVPQEVAREADVLPPDRRGVRQKGVWHRRAG